MKTRYIDLIEQTFDFPRDEFKLDDDKLVWNDLPLTELLEKHGTPLRISYLPEDRREDRPGHGSSFAKAFTEHTITRPLRILLLHQEQPLQLRHRQGAGQGREPGDQQRL